MCKKNSKYRPMCHCHLHSYFSILDGAGRIDDYIKQAQEYNQPAITILDHGNMSGTFEFYQKCKAAGIKPILGMEAYLNDSLDYRPSNKKEENKEGYEGKDTHQSILVKNEQGFKNLNKLTYLSFTEGYYRRGRITTDWLLEHKEGLVVTSSCLASKISRLLSDGKEREAEERIRLFLKEFGDDFYAELQFNEVEEQKAYNHFILRMIKKYDIQPILTGDVHYANREDARLQDVLIAINQHKPVGEAFSLDARNLYFTSSDDFYRMNKEFGYNYPENFVTRCLDNTLDVADKCNFDFELETEKYPKYEPTRDVLGHFKTDDTKEIITKLSHGKLGQKLKLYKENGLVNINDDIARKYRERLNYELKVINDKKMLDYFLIVWELIRFCASNGIEVGPGRGCFLPGSRVRMSDGYFSPIESIIVGDCVVDAFGEEQIVVDTLEYDIDEEVVELEMEDGRIINCTLDHEILTKNRGWVKAIDLNENDDISEI